MWDGGREVAKSTEFDGSPGTHASLIALVCQQATASIGEDRFQTLYEAMCEVFQRFNVSMPEMAQLGLGVFIAGLTAMLVPLGGTPGDLSATMQQLIAGVPGGDLAAFWSAQQAKKAA